MSAQLENGFTRIAHEIVEAMAKLKISNYESRFLWCLFRKTYGYGKKEDKISLSQFEKMTNIASQHIARAKKSLLAKNIIYIDNNKIGIENEIPKWVVPIQVVPIQATSSTSLGSKSVPIQVDTIDKIDNIQKKAQLMSADSFFNPLKEINGKQVELKAKQFDVRDKDIVYCANMSYEWCIGKDKVEDTSAGWNSFFNQWILRSIRRHELKTNSDKTQDKKSKPKLTEEDKWIIQMKKAGRFIN